MTSFLDIVAANGIAFRQSHNGELSFCCPFCQERGEGEDNRFRLSLNTAKDKSYCFNCGYKAGSRARFWFLRKLIAGRVPDELAGEIGTAPARQAPCRLPADFIRLAEANMREERDARRYLLRRGITAQQIDRYDIGACFTGRFTHRVIFPVIARRRLLSFVARDYTGLSDKRYLNFSGGRYLFGLNGKRAYKQVWLLEGIVKALKAEEALGIKAAALLGHSITDAQIEQLEASGVQEVVLWPDPNRVGLTGALGVAEQIKKSLALAVRMVYAAKQTCEVDDMDTDEIRRSASSVEPLSWALVQRVKLLASER